MGQSINEFETNECMNGWILRSVTIWYPADFAGADDIISNLAEERESGIEIIERIP